MKLLKLKTADEEKTLVDILVKRAEEATEAHEPKVFQLCICLLDRMDAGVKEE